MNYYLTKEELRVIRESLIVYQRQVKSDLYNQFSDKLDKQQKIEPYLYDDAIRIVKITNELYKHFDPEKQVVKILKQSDESSK